LVELRNQLHKRLKTVKTYKDQKRFSAEVEKIEKLIAWLLLYTEWNRTKTLISNYSKLNHFVSAKDNRIHCTLSLTSSKDSEKGEGGTRTGRLSASNPNLLTLPNKRGVDLRKAFIPCDGFEFLSADYAGAEFVALAYVTQDPELIRIVTDGLSIHDENTKAVFGITPDDPDWNQKRKVMKTYQFGRIQYGGSDAEIFRKILVECPELKMTLDEFKVINRKYFEKHPVQAEWIRTQQEIALKTRVVSTALGFQRRLYGSDADIKKQAINTPIQGLIVHLINRAMIDIEDRLECEKTIFTYDFADL